MRGKGPVNLIHNSNIGHSWPRRNFQVGLENDEFELARIRCPRQRTSISYHLFAEEYYFVLAGSGHILLNGETRTRTAGDFLRLPPGATRGFKTFDEPYVEHPYARLSATARWVLRWGVSRRFCATLTEQPFGHLPRAGVYIPTSLPASSHPRYCSGKPRCAFLLIFDRSRSTFSP